MEKLSTLTPSELLCLQGHIKLGKDHLIAVSGKHQFQDLLRLSRPSHKSIDQIKVDEREIWGNLIPVLNTIITGCLGGWMGLATVMDLGLNSPWILGLILCLTTLVGVAIGYHSLRFTKQESTEAIQTLQMLQLEMEILEEVHKDRIRKLDEIRQDLRSSIRTISPSKLKDDRSDDLFEALLQAIDDRIASYPQHPSHSFLKKEIAIVKTRIEKNFKDHPSQKEASQSQSSASKRELPHVIELLVQSRPKQAEFSKIRPRQSVRKLGISLVPLLLGGFSSCFVYLAGSTQIAQDFEHEALVVFLTHPTAKLVKLLIAILATVGMGFLFIDNAKKNHRRTLEIAKKRKLVGEKESLIARLDEDLFKWIQTREGTHEICEMLFAADETSSDSGQAT